LAYLTLYLKKPHETGSAEQGYDIPRYTSNFQKSGLKVLAKKIVLK